MTESELIDMFLLGEINEEEFLELMEEVSYYNEEEMK